VSRTNPGRNDPCPCGSGRKFKHCCLQARTDEESARLRLRAVEGRVVDTLMEFIQDSWGAALVAHAWEDFWNYDDVPQEHESTPEFHQMFIPWIVLGFVPDPEAEDPDAEWPAQPIGLEWLETTATDIPDLDRLYIQTACRSPMSIFAV